MRLKFNELAEFLAELEKRGPTLENVVRATIRYRPHSQIGGAYEIGVMATYLRGAGTGIPILVTLDARCGRYTGVEGDEGSAEARQRAEGIRDQIGAAAERLGLEIAPGVYEEAG